MCDKALIHTGEPGYMNRPIQPSLKPLALSARDGLDVPEGKARPYQVCVVIRVRPGSLEVSRLAPLGVSGQCRATIWRTDEIRFCHCDPV